MCKILSRIKTLAETEGISIGSIERAIGASRGVISKAITKGTDIQSKWLELICEKFPQYSPTWLLTGQGEMFQGITQAANRSITESPKIPPGIIAMQDARKLSQQDAEVPFVTQLIAELKDLAIENGMLKARIKQLEGEAAQMDTPRYVSQSSLETVPT